MTGRKTAHWLAVVMLTLAATVLIRARIIRDPSLRVPLVIAYLCAGVFLTGAFAVWQQIVGGPTRGHGAAVLILAGFTIMGGWVALSPNAGGCTVGVNGAGTSTSGLACRVPFGVGALISGLMTIYAAKGWIRARRHNRAGVTHSNSPNRANQAE